MRIKCLLFALALILPVGAASAQQPQPTPPPPATAADPLEVQLAQAKYDLAIEQSKNHDLLELIAMYEAITGKQQRSAPYLQNIQAMKDALDKAKTAAAVKATEPKGGDAHK